MDCDDLIAVIEDEFDNYEEAREIRELLDEYEDAEEDRREEIEDRIGSLLKRLASRVGGSGVGILVRVLFEIGGILGDFWALAVYGVLDLSFSNSTALAIASLAANGEMGAEPAGGQTYSAAFTVIGLATGDDQDPHPAYHYEIEWVPHPAGVPDRMTVEGEGIQTAFKTGLPSAGVQGARLVPSASSVHDCPVGHATELAPDPPQVCFDVQPVVWTQGDTQRHLVQYTAYVYTHRNCPEEAAYRQDKQGSKVI